MSGKAPSNLGKRKRVSKNKKRNWKLTDIQDVEEYLDDTRLQIRTGGLAAEKKDDELFVLEKDIKKEQNLTDESVPNKRRRKERKPLKCQALLEPDPLIKPVAGNRNLRKDPDTKTPKNIEQKEKQLNKQREAAKQERKLRLARRKEKSFALNPYDVWSETAATGLLQDDHYATVTKKRPVKAPVFLQKKPSGLPAVEVPPAGASYNPTLEDHQALLLDAHMVEVERKNEADKLERALEKQFPTSDQAPTEESWLKEMSSGLGAEGSESDEEEEEDGEAGSEDGEDENCVLSNPPIRRDNKKTLKQRRKEKARKAQEKLRKEEKEAKLRKQELFRLRSLKVAVKERVQELTGRAEKKAKLKELYKDKPKKLGKHRFEAPDMEVKLSDELEGSLRLLKPEGNLLEDRYKSLQKRNIIEARRRSKKRKPYKPKVFEKKGHKSIA